MISQYSTTRTVLSDLVCFAVSNYVDLVIYIPERRNWDLVVRRICSRKWRHAPTRKLTALFLC